MFSRIKQQIQKEAVLFISAVCALLTLFLVPPDREYLGYIDWSVLCLLFCLMAVVEGFRSCGLFRLLTRQVLCRGKGGRSLGVVLVLLPFFCSMLLTNDVALLVFVPFTLSLLTHIGCRKAVVPVLCLQTVAANLGSMATPVGNPQNLYLYTAYGLSPAEFFTTLLPLTGISLALLLPASLFLLPRELPPMEQEESALHRPRHFAVYGLLFLLCLLTVFRVIPYFITTGAVVVFLVLFDRPRLRKVDFALLATFVFFFIVSGNLGRLDWVQEFLQSLLHSSPLLTAVGASQIISNVPAAILLSGFTENWQALLQGTNIGGLGTPIASLASLITLKLYLREPDAKGGKFLLFFTLVNVAGLIVLIGATLLL